LLTKKSPSGRGEGRKRVPIYLLAGKKRGDGMRRAVPARGIAVSDRACDKKSVRVRPKETVQPMAGKRRALKRKRTVSDH